MGWSPAAVDRPRDPALGILIMVVGIALFSVLNAVVKAQSEFFPVNQIMFFRNSFALPAVSFFLYQSGVMTNLGNAPIGKHVTLGLLFTLSLFLVFSAYAMLPLADATAIAFSQPLFVFVLASLFSNERANTSGWVSVVIGLFGVMLMVQPQGSGQSMGYIFALVGSFVSAISMLVQRSLALRETAVAISLFTLGVSAIVTVPTLFFSWVTPSPLQLMGLMAMGVTSGLLTLLTTQAFYHASAALIAPVTYTKMIWAVIIGYLWFGDVPSTEILIGATIVLAVAALNFNAARISPNITPPQ